MRIDRMNEITQIYKSKAAKPIKEVTKQNQDELNISSHAIEYNKAQQLVKDVPDIRMEKVGPIKEQIRTGTYNVDAKEVAQKMLSQFDMRG